MTPPAYDRHMGTASPRPMAFVENDLDAILIGFQRDVRAARALGVNPAQLTRWRQGQRPDDANERRIRELARAVRELGTAIPVEAIPDWMNSPEVRSGLSPGDLLRADRYEDMRAMLREMVQGDVWS
jgi:hypothetical protein